MADRRGYQVEKSGRRDPAASDYDRWRITPKRDDEDVDFRTKILAAIRRKWWDGREWLTIGELETFLSALRDKEEMAAMRKEAGF
jgi:hypothetical protein